MTELKKLEMRLKDAEMAVGEALYIARNTCGAQASAEAWAIYAEWEECRKQASEKLRLYEKRIALAHRFPW